MPARLFIGIFIMCCFSQTCFAYSYYSDQRNTAYLKLSFGGSYTAPLKRRDSVRRPSSNKMQPAFELGAGYKFMPYIRADVNVYKTGLNYKNKKYALRLQQKIRTTAIMANAHFSFDLPMFVFRPFVTVGYGVAKNHAYDLKSEKNPNIKYLGSNSVNKAWSVGAGISFEEISHLYSIDLSYKYMNFGEIANFNRYNNKKYKTKVITHLALVSGSFYF